MQIECYPPLGVQQNWGLEFKIKNDQTDMATVLQHQVSPDITSVAGEFMGAGVQSAQGGHYQSFATHGRWKNTGIISQWQQ